MHINGNGEKVAIGIKLANGSHFRARKEAIISCGAHNTPQILMLSSIRPAEELKKLGIVQAVESPDVSRNFLDHLVLFQAYKLRHPELGLTTGCAAWNNPAYLRGHPVDWAVGNTADQSSLKAALEAESAVIDDNQSHLGARRAHTGGMVAYVVFGHGFGTLIDGSHIITAAVLFLPTSRRTVTLASTNPKEDPVVDPGYYNTHPDCYRLISVLRRMMRVVKTPEMQSVIECEAPPPGLPWLRSQSTDEDIDARVQADSAVIYHTAGTAAMGMVVDSKLLVNGGS